MGVVIMAGVGMPKLEAQCGCGEVLVRDYDGSSLYWTRTISILKAAGDAQLNAEKCPECGGDERIPMGSFYHKRWHENLPEGLMVL